jgi:hypothetical protein
MNNHVVDYIASHTADIQSETDNNFIRLRKCSCKVRQRQKRRRRLNHHLYPLQVLEPSYVSTRVYIGS